MYFNWVKEENDSTHISFNPPPNAVSGLRGGATGANVNCDAAGLNPCTPELFEYEKRQIGAELGWRVTPANKLTAGLEYTDYERERADFQENEEYRVFAEWKNSTFDWMTSRLKYQYMHRTGEFNPHPEVLAANPMDLFVRRFDVANVDQNLVKAAFDFTPAPLFDLGVEVIYKENRYQDTPLGRTEDTRYEVYGSVGYGDPKRWRVHLFGDVEYVKFDSRHRVGTGNPDPATPPNATTYNWTSKNEDDSWQVGIGFDWAVMTRLMLKASLIYAETDGHTDFTVQAGGDPTPRPAIEASDDTTRVAFNLRGIYELSRAWQLTAGYAYEKYRFSDIAYDGTRYVVGALASNTSSIVTGQFSFQNYEAHIAYLVGKYRFCTALPRRAGQPGRAAVRYTIELVCNLQGETRMKATDHCHSGRGVRRRRGARAVGRRRSENQGLQQLPRSRQEEGRALVQGHRRQEEGPGGRARRQAEGRQGPSQGRRLRGRAEGRGRARYDDEVKLEVCAYRIALGSPAARRLALSRRPRRRTARKSSNRPASVAMAPGRAARRRSATRRPGASARRRGFRASRRARSRASATCRRTAATRAFRTSSSRAASPTWSTSRAASGPSLRALAS